MDPATVVEQFTQFYYDTFDTNRLGLVSLYRGTSTLSFEGNQFKGIEDIGEKFQSLPFERIKHQVGTKDFQAGPNGSLLVVVTGQIWFDNQEAPQLFSQSFTLIAEGTSFYVHNDIFRLCYGV
ncbi:Nuclear transport factor 2 [Actinomortierella ambigua]|nr:Nuclear transport factor 2 [Actinomortierella ambigua]